MNHPGHAMPPRELDPGTVALDGINLIEASAGTGKTYNITALFLRALLVFRDSTAELAIPNVLVVTFTEAATQELRERIRSRLREAIAALEQGSCGEHDAFLAGLLESHQGEEARTELARYLTTQLRRFDEAAIFTIHGFCQRVLQENTFDAGSLFELELTQDDRGLIRDAVEDVWRRQVAELDPEFAAYLASAGITPARLADQARLVLGKPGSQWYPVLPGDAEAAPLAELNTAYRALRERWQGCHEALRERMLEARGAYAANAVLHTRPESLFAPAHLFFAAEEFAFTTHDLSALAYFRLSQINKVKKGQTPPPDEHGFFQACEEFLLAAERCRSALAVRLQVWKQAFFRATADCLRRLKQQRQLQSFDDLLNDVAQALARNPELGARLHARYPIALIDEFQDTDPVQYRIFETIYRPRGGTLFMIGDPKQAIYGFRGGDIYTYIGARRQVDPGRAYTLGRNHRSVAGLVKAVNGLFEDGEVPTFGHDAIPFLPVEAAGRIAEHHVRLDGEPQAPFQLMAVPGAPMRAGPARQFIARHTAYQIAHLLNLGQAGRLCLETRPVEPADIAVLVRSHKEGRLMREALAACGVRSVEYAQDSLFDSDEAHELERLLRAIADPGDRNALPTALACPLLGQDAATVLAVREGGPEWERWYHRFLDYQARWREQGVAAMLQYWLHDAAGGPSVAETLVRSDGGERRLTNVLHLIEVLQEVSSREALGMAGLVKWLARQRDPQLRVGEARELRLESDEKLVKIVTVHKSKGLQYPIVFCPFLWSSGKAPSAPFVFHTEDGKAAIELGNKDLPDYQDHYRRHQRQAGLEAAQEEMRLLYVALTRAQYQCYVAFGAIGGRGKRADSAKSALARLLRLEESAYADSDAMAAALEAYAAARPGRFGALRLPRPACRYAPPTETPALAPRPFSGRIVRNWAIASYSALSQGRPERELRADDDRAVPVAVEAGDDFFAFTRGRLAGSFLHALLESVDFAAIDRAALAAEIARLAARYRIQAERWTNVLLDAIERIVATPLAADGLCLAAIPRPARLPELNFHFPLAGRSGALAGYLRQRGVAGDGWERALRLLDGAPPAGLMTGAIDLVFRHQGRYYLADFKSNHLGDDYTDYAPDKLATVMAEEAYDLQLLIYTLALHRHLAARLPGYSYEQHLGGAFYLFLRGMHPQQPGAGVYAARPPVALIAALDDYYAGEKAHA